MTVICNELDKRIKDFSDIQSYIQYDDKYVGEYGYFSDSIIGFSDLDSCTRSVLANIDEMGGTDMIFDDGENYYRFFIPEDALKPAEKQYRPYKNVQELFEDIGVYIGDTIHFRSKAKETEHHDLITSYETPKNGAETLSFGGFLYRYTMQELFDSFELRSRGEWLPFGIEVEDD